MVALKYSVTVRIKDSNIEPVFEFYTIEEAAKFTQDVLRHYKGDMSNITTIISMITDDVQEGEICE